MYIMLYDLCANISRQKVARHYGRATFIRRASHAGCACTLGTGIRRSRYSHAYTTCKAASVQSDLASTYSLFHSKALHSRHSFSNPSLCLSGQAIGSKSLPHVCSAWRVASGNVQGISLPLRIAIYSDRCALFFLRHLRAYSLYLALLFSRQVARYSLLALGGLPLIAFEAFHTQQLAHRQFLQTQALQR